MTKELIEKRIAELNAEAEKGRATLNAIAGALQDCQFWLSQIDETAPKLSDPKVE